LQIKVLIPIRINLPDGMKMLQAGDRMDLPEKKARKLVKLAKGKVRLVEPLLHPGVWIEFFSPFFGMCTARIHEVTVDGCVITNHSVLKGKGEPVTIPASLLCGIYREASL